MVLALEDIECRQDRSPNAASSGLRTSLFCAGALDHLNGLSLGPHLTVFGTILSRKQRLAAIPGLLMARNNGCRKPSNHRHNSRFRDFPEPLI